MSDHGRSWCHGAWDQPLAACRPAATQQTGGWLPKPAAGPPQPAAQLRAAAASRALPPSRSWLVSLASPHCCACLAGPGGRLHLSSALAGLAGRDTFKSVETTVGGWGAACPPHSRRCHLPRLADGITAQSGASQARGCAAPILLLHAVLPVCCRALLVGGLPLKSRRGAARCPAAAQLPAPAAAAPAPAQSQPPPASGWGHRPAG